MNLHEMHQRQVGNFAFSPAATPAQKTIGETEYLGLQLAPADTPHIIIRNVFGHRLLRSFPPRASWQAVGDKGAALSLRLVTTNGEVLAKRNQKLDATPVEIDLPWPALSTTPLPECDIQLTVSGGGAFLAVSRRLDRKAISGLCRGKGVEIGPGVTPQILPAHDIDVLYAEEKNREDWLSTYAYKLDKYQGNLDILPWDRYRVADAFNLPAEDSSLDFIFASHVLEHLVNPIGHLQHWLAKLKSGGIIAGILPHCDYSVDCQHFPSMLPTMVMEYQRRDTRPALSHYRLMFGKNAENMMAQGRTLHVHFYNERNLQDLLGFMHSQMGAGSFRIVWEPNYREFFFTLTKR